MPTLEHEPELVLRLAQMYDGNAGAHLRRISQSNESRAEPRLDWTQHEMLAASSLVIAASLWSLVDPHAASSRYRDAARMYRALEHSYWMVLALASGNGEEIRRMPAAIEETLDPTPQTLAFAMVGNEVAKADGQATRAERLDAHWRHAGNIPVGRLGIPLDYYARSVRGMRDARAERDLERFAVEAGNYVHRAAEVLRGASHDRFHWLRLQSAILPAEPEAVAMTTAMSLMSHSMFGMSLSSMPNLNLDAHGQLLVEIGDDIRLAAAGDDLRGSGI